jgi:hypothetical protein
MNYHYFFLILHYYVGVHLSNSSQLHAQLFDFQNNTNNQSSIIRSCPSFITYNQVVALLAINTCPSFEKSNKINDINHRKRRQIDSRNLDIKAIQTTINDNRNMIQYLFNNSINQTILIEELNKHSCTQLSLTSWRDWVDIISMGLFLIILIYVFAWLVGFSLCHQLFIFFFRPIFNRIQQQQLQQSTVALTATTANNNISNGTTAHHNRNTSISYQDC